MKQSSTHNSTPPVTSSKESTAQHSSQRAYSGKKRTRAQDDKKNQPEAPSIAVLRQRLDDAELTTYDAAVLRRRLRRARSPRDRRSIERSIAAASMRMAARRAATPEVSYPDALPVSARREDILNAIRDHQVVVIAGETGSGKTTQIPKMCLELGRGVAGMIGHTQPRRLAARTVAERIAEELGQQVGDSVGYAIRFDDRVSPSTSIKLMTDGILLAEMQRDRDLLAYDTIIIDEAHERSLNIDYLLGYLKQLLPRRPDLKVIITSATIDPQRFADHFAEVTTTTPPVIEVSGRTYPVEIRYRPMVQTSTRKDGSVVEIDRDPLECLVEACEELMKEGPGDILAFFASERDIREAAEILEGQRWRNTEITMLFGRLSNQEQHRIFQPHSGRRIVLSTNIAETSLTVPGIHYVIDTGTARISRYSLRTKVQRLPIEPISQASARQRSGRCGRIADGIAIRLYSEADFNARPAFTDPEILRTNLASVILHMANLRLGDIAEFPFVDSPEARSIRDGLLVLHELGALGEGEHPDGSPELTEIGRLLARIPLDPRLGRMLIEAQRRGVMEAATVVVAALTVQDVRERPADREAQAQQLHARFRNRHSDFLTYLRLWAYLSAQREALSGNAFRKMCLAECLHYMRTREWMDLVRQIRGIAEEVGWNWDENALSPVPSDESTPPGMPDIPEILVDSDALHLAILTGLLSHIGLREENSKEYRGTRGTHFWVFPGSGLAKKPPAWVVATEIVETSMMFARDVAEIKPEWLEQVASHLLKHSYSEPQWSRNRASAVAYQRSTLFGLPVVTDRPINLGSIDPQTARDIFIRSALVEGDWNTNHQFFHDNRAKVDEAGEIEEKARRRDLVIDDEALFAFYDKRLPADVISGRHFDRWWKKKRSSDPHLLDFDPEALLSAEASQITETDFPDRWRARHVDLDLTYRFEPGTEDDGVSVRIPLPIIGSISWEDGFDWQVPGLRTELVTALIRSLPKSMRTSVVPVPEYAAKALAVMTPYSGPMGEALATALRSVGGVGMTASSFSWESLPQHLRMNFQVIDRQGKVVDQDRDLDALIRRQASASSQAMTAVMSRQAASMSSAGGSGALGNAGASAPVDTNTDTHRGGSRQRSHAPGGDSTRGKGKPDGGSPRGAGRGSTAVAAVYPTWTAETIGTLAESVDAVVDGLHTTAFPSLRVTAKGIEMITCATRAQADTSLFQAELTLLLSAVSVNTAQMVKGLALTQRVAVDRYPHGGLDGLISDCRVAAVRDAFLAAGGAVRDPDAFTTIKNEVLAKAPSLTRSMVVTMAQSLVTYASVAQTLEKWSGPAIDDMKAQLAAVLPKNAVTRFGVGRLRHLDRYMKAVEVRLESMDRDPDRDADRQDEVNEVEAYLAKRLEHLPPVRAHSAQVADVVFQIQELRVGLFAERLGTAQRVSAKRIMKAIDQLR